MWHISIGKGDPILGDSNGIFALEEILDSL
jgi:hypothetical protein